MVAGKTMVEHIIERMKKVRNADDIYICTSTHVDDQVLEAIAIKNNVKFYAGSEQSVIDRLLEVGEKENADNVVRVTADNIFTDSVYMDVMIDRHKKHKVDYTRTEYLPVGLTAEVISVEALHKCYERMDPNDSQYLMLYMFQPEHFHCLVVVPPSHHQKPDWLLTVDTPKDWERTEKIFSEFTGFISYEDIIEYSKENAIVNMVRDAAGLVKIPAGLIFYSDSLRYEKDIRISRSEQYAVEQGEYLKVLNAQAG